MINIKIYNAEQIGGCFTVITTSNAKIMIDYGLPLPGSKAEQEDFDWEHDTVDAVFITHYHGDHVGKILDIPSSIPIYMGNATKTILLNIHEALVHIPEYKEEQNKWLALLNSNRIKKVEKNKIITDINGIQITPFNVDHSAYDAYMYLIEADDEVALFTGDFRGHGYRGHKMLDVIKYYVHKNGRKVDYLITEGTMIGDRKEEKVKTEEQLKKEAVELFRQNKYIFLVISSTNLDSLASFYRAADQNDMQMYCYSYYLFKQLKTFSKSAGIYTPKYRFKNIHTVAFEEILPNKFIMKDKTQEQLMREHGFVCIIKPEEKYHKWIEHFKDKNPLVIYSMWDGYINKKKGKEAYNKKWADFFAPYIASGQYRDMHTSGHATPKMIADVIKAVAPQKAIYPMHTENAEEFMALAIDERYKNIIRINKKSIMEQYQLLAEKVQKKLQENTVWVERYKNYAEGILANKNKIEQGKRKFNVPYPLGCYITLGNSINGKTTYDLRYLGQSVGEIRIKNNQPLLFVTKTQSNNNSKFFNYALGTIKQEPWETGKKASEFKTFFTNMVNKDKMPRQKEHMVEARLFQELAKDSSEDKQLLQIQPINFAECFTHMKTAVAGSNAKKGKISVVNKGGEIDIFCRKTVNSTETRLTVIEVKDKLEKNETFETAMFQAISYAVFIRELIHTSSGSKWMKIWGMNSQKTDGIIINAVVAIPISSEKIPDFHGQVIQLGKDKIALHYMALKKSILETDGEVYIETTL